MKKIATIIFSCVVGLSMTMAPTLASGTVYAEETQEQTAVAAESLDGDQTGDAVSSEQSGDDVNADQTDETADEESVELTAASVGEGSGVAEGSALEGLAGKNISDIQNDPELSYVLEDPTFYRYYEVDEDGVISEKKVDLDEVEKFLAEADANADGIDDTDNVETNGDITAMGGGVSGLGKGQTPSKYSAYTRYHCIDISWWQGKVSDSNWQKIKAAGVTHAIIRCGYSSLSGGAHHMDSTFSNNINGAYKAGIKVGVYYYSTAVSAAEAKSEAQYVTSILGSYKSKITLPVAYDYETGGRLTSKVMKRVGTASCTAFCDTIKAAGYVPMVYANYNTLNNHIDYRTLQSKYKIWLANYTSNGVATTYAGDYWMWQYSSSGRVNGLSGKIDINYIFEPKTSSSSSSVQSSVSSSGVSSSDPVSTFASYKAKVKSTANYRTGPGKSYKKKGFYKKGKKVRVVGMSGKWAKLSNGYYMKAKYLVKIKNSKYPCSAKTTDSVNYRTGPGTSYKIKGTYSKGVKIKIKSVKNGWGKMSNGYYISMKYVK